MNDEDIRSLVEDSLEETEATSQVVERAQNAHERARDLMRQGLFEEALGRFREALEGWEEQAAICRDRGFKNLWRGKPEQIGREMEDLRISHLDVLDPGEFKYLRKRAELRHEMLAALLELARQSGGTTESRIFDFFPEHQHAEVRGVLFHAQNRGWLVRRKERGAYAIHATLEAPDLNPGGETV